MSSEVTTAEEGELSESSDSVPPAGTNDFTE